MLEAAPDTPRAIYTDIDIDIDIDIDSEPDNIILAVAVRSCQQTCEMLTGKMEMKALHK